MIRLPCHNHLWHDVDDTDAARIVSALTAAHAEEITERDGDRPDAGDEPYEHMVCPDEVLRWSHDCEVYFEHVDGAILAAGIVRHDPDVGRLVVPWGEREPQRDGRAS